MFDSILYLKKLLQEKGQGYAILYSLPSLKFAAN